jgi:hypothetical protein
LKNTLLLVIVGAALVAIVLAREGAQLPIPVPSQPPPPKIISQGPTLERLERLAHLVTLKVYVADVLTGEGDGCRGAWLIRGDALIAVDLSRARIAEKDEAAKKAIIMLPQPVVLQSRVDHTRTKTWEVKKITWVPWSGDQDHLRDAVMLQAQQLVAHAAEAEENIGRAKAVADSVIKAFYEEVDWKVAVAWEPATKANQPTTPAKPPSK